MRKTVSCILLAVFCLSLAACSAPDNFPGQVKPKYWVSEDEKIIFFFPAEAGRGNAEGRMIVDEAICRDIILEWNGKDGTVEVMDTERTFLFRADTVTDKDDLSCTFHITSKSSKVNLPDTIMFYWEQEIPDHLAGNEYMPANTSLDLWILQDVSLVDWSGYTENPGWFGAHEFYGKGYAPIISENGVFTDPEHCVKYLVTAWPDCADGGQYVTRITVTDPAVTMWGLTVESSVEQFDSVLSAMGFQYNGGEESDPGTEYKVGWSCGNYSITLLKRNGKCVVNFCAPVSNRDNIQF